MGQQEFENAVRSQDRKFRAELPKLLRTKAGRWAVFFDGLRHDSDDQWEALAWASEHLGDESPFVVARIEEPHTVLLTAALAFGAPPR